MQDRYIWLLIGLFFFGVFADFLTAALFSRTLAAGLVLAVAIGLPLCFLLRARLLECGFSPRWAVLGLFPAIGFPLGLVLYFCPSAEERHPAR